MDQKRIISKQFRELCADLIYKGHDTPPENLSPSGSYNFLEFRKSRYLIDNQDGSFDFDDLGKNIYEGEKVILKGRAERAVRFKNAMHAPEFLEGKKKAKSSLVIKMSK